MQDSITLTLKAKFQKAVEEAGNPTKPGQLFKSALGIWLESFVYDTYTDPHSGKLENIVMWKEQSVAL